MIGSINYSSVAKGDFKASPTLPAGEITQKVNVSDSKSVEIFHTDVGTLNPIYDTLEGSRNSDEKNHVYEYINKFKICEIATTKVGRYPPLITSNAWGNWRGNFVNPNVYLFAEEKNFQFSYKHKYGNAWEAMNKGAIGMVRGALEAARSLDALAGGNAGSIPNAGRFMPQYSKAPVWESVDPIALPSSLKFNFNFGQAGIFSGEHEVVRPIIQLATLFAPVHDGEFYYRGPVPTAPHFYANLFAQLGSKLKGAKENMAAARNDGDSENDRSALSGAVKALTAVEKELLKLMNDTIESTLGIGHDDKEKGFSTALCLRMGRMTFGPAIVWDVNWSFDFTQVDEFGYPYKGSITFGGLESVVIPDAGQVRSQFQNIN